LHDWQKASQRALQHTPWAQKPLRHSASLAQSSPIDFLPQEKSRQVFGATQSMSPLHELPQRLPLHL
jgi:hypothetical protein